MANENEDFDAFRAEYDSPAPQPRALTKKEYLELPENIKLKKNIRSSAIICYVAALLSGAVGFLVLDTGAFILLDVAILVGLGLGVHLKQSKVCSVLLLVYAVASCILNLISNGQASGWLIILAGVYAVSATFKLDKQWKEYARQGY